MPPCIGPNFLALGKEINTAYGRNVRVRLLLQCFPSQVKTRFIDQLHTGQWQLIKISSQAYNTLVLTHLWTWKIWTSCIHRSRFRDAWAKHDTNVSASWQWVHRDGPCGLKAQGRYTGTSKAYGVCCHWRWNDPFQPFYVHTSHVRGGGRVSSKEVRKNQRTLTWAERNQIRRQEF